MESKFITIIIPCYNSSMFIKDSLESLVQQKLKAKVLIADGGSTDNTLEIIENFKNKLKIEIVSKSDSGQSDAINIMLHHVKTPYFLWFNSDDILLPNAVITFENFLKSNILRPHMISADHYDFDINGKLKNIYGSNQYKSHILKGVWRGDFPSLIWKKESVVNAGLCNIDLHFSMDQDLVYKIALNSKTQLISAHIPVILSGFRFHNDSKTTGKLYLDKIQKENTLFLNRYSLNSIDFFIGRLIYYLKSPRIILKKIFN